MSEAVGDWLEGWRRLQDEGAIPVCLIGISRGAGMDRIELIRPKGIDDEVLVETLRNLLALIEGN